MYVSALQSIPGWALGGPFEQAAGTTHGCREDPLGSPLTRPLTEEPGLFGLGETKLWNVRIIDETSFELLPPIAIVETREDTHKTITHATF